MSKSFMSHGSRIYKKIRIRQWSIFWKVPLIFLLIEFLFESVYAWFGRMTIYFTWSKMQIFAEANTELLKPIFQENFYLFYENSGIQLMLHKLLSLFVVLFFVFFIDRYKMKTLGLEIQFKSLFLGVFGILLASATIGILYVVWLLNNNIVLQNAVANIQSNLVRESLIFQSVLFLLVAFHEEIFGRSYLINETKWMGRTLCVLLPSLFFALLHLMNISGSRDTTLYAVLKDLLLLNVSPDKYIGILNIFLLALIFSVYYLIYREVWLLIGYHFAWNFVMGPVMGLNVSHINDWQDVSLFPFKTQGSIWLTGGEFGPEGSVLLTGLFLIILTTLIYVKWMQKTNIRKITQK